MEPNLRWWERIVPWSVWKRKKGTFSFVAVNFLEHNFYKNSFFHIFSFGCKLFYPARNFDLVKKISQAWKIFQVTGSVRVKFVWGHRNDKIDAVEPVEIGTHSIKYFRLVTKNGPWRLFTSPRFIESVPIRKNKFWLSSKKKISRKSRSASGWRWLFSRWRKTQPRFFFSKKFAKF